MRPRAILAPLASLSLTLACRESTAPYRDVTTRLEIDRRQVTVGDIVQLRAIATNESDRTIRFMAGCGLGLDFEVQRPSGERAYLLRDLPSTCPIFDSNLLEPGETDTVSHAWTVPLETGTYRFWAGGRVPEGLAARSMPVDVRVQ
jgi:hypothetical protein